MATDLGDRLVRWTKAGLIDEETAARIRQFEGEHAGAGRLRWPMLVALAFGAIMVATGILLFVSAHWDILSPHRRFTLVLMLVAIFHVVGATMAERFPAMSSTLHALGTVALGAGIFLAGQIFNLDEHWPGGIMLWALGPAVGMAMLGQAPQVALLAILAPAWLASEWFVATERAAFDGSRILASGVLLLALAYFTVPTRNTIDVRRRSLFWIGGVSLLPAAAFTALVASEVSRTPGTPHVTGTLRSLGWATAVALPTMLALLLRGKDAWPNLLAAAWVAALCNLRAVGGDAFLYAWWAIGATSLVAWGVRDAGRERINMGAAIFAATVIAFYFSEVMDKLGRSASLVGLGLLFLAGGWALERIRRRLISSVRGST